VVVYLSWLDDEASLAPSNMSPWFAIATKVRDPVIV
jgi:hypothetical protein